MTADPNPAAVPGRRNLLGWLSLFGPGAVIASLTIGAGELIFSSRGGAVFGYPILGMFLLVCFLKWILVMATARHMVLTGAHPFERWAALGGAHGWLPMAFLILAILSFPIWVGFHSGTLGTLVAYLTGTRGALGGAMHLVWGMVLLGVVFLMTMSGGYQRLEKIQLAIVLIMLVCVMGSLILLRPDWWEMAKGLFQPHLLAYPGWARDHEVLRGRPAWIELATYAGVVGGGGYDYLAYVSYLRVKHWGQAGRPLAARAELEAAAADPRHPNRQWLRAPLIDATISFAIVFLFCAVFVAGGKEVLGARHQIPEGGDLLTLQAQFVAAASPWLKPFYFAGAFLAIFGTLYGTIEVAPAILEEIRRALFPGRAEEPGGSKRWRNRAVGWSAIGGLVVLVWMLWMHLSAGTEKPPGLVALLTPANLFTGVFACGVICLLSLWSDWKVLPAPLRPGWAPAGLTFVAGCVFLALGIKGYWDHSGALAFVILAGTLVVAVGLAAVASRQRGG